MVIYYYDATALGSNYTGNDQDFHWVVVHEFERHGFRKNKSMEKQPESEEDLLEHRTDGTDTFDTLYTGWEKFPQHDLYPITNGGVSWYFC